MWKSIAKSVITTLSKNENVLLTADNIMHQQLRTTFILKRKFAPPLHRKGGKEKVLKTKHYIYELVRHEESQKQKDLEVILTSYVEGLGNKGDRVSVKPTFAYEQLLLPGLAVYVSPENMEKYKQSETDKSEESCSSPTALLTVKTLSTILLSVVMNKDTPWVLKPWHIRASFRKCGYIVPEHTITLPQQEIKGPNLDLENKEFFVTVTINKQEKVNVRCRIHHWSTEIKERLPYVKHFWTEETEALLDDQSAVLSSMPHKKDHCKPISN